MAANMASTRRQRVSCRQQNSFLLYQLLVSLIGRPSKMLPLSIVGVLLGVVTVQARHSDTTGGPHWR